MMHLAHNPLAALEDLVWRYLSMLASSCRGLATGAGYSSAAAAAGSNHRHPAKPQATVARTDSKLPACAPDPSAWPDVAIDDWDILMRAVLARLRRIMDDRDAALPDGLGGGNAEAVRAGVLDCISGLEQLHLTIVHEFDRRRPVDPGVRTADAAQNRGSGLETQDQQ